MSFNFFDFLIHLAQILMNLAQEFYLFLTQPLGTYIINSYMWQHFALPLLGVLYEPMKLLIETVFTFSIMDNFVIFVMIGILVAIVKHFLPTA